MGKKGNKRKWVILAIWLKLDACCLQWYNIRPLLLANIYSSNKKKRRRELSVLRLYITITQFFAKNVPKIPQKISHRFLFSRTVSQRFSRLSRTIEPALHYYHSICHHLSPAERKPAFFSPFETTFGLKFQNLFKKGT
jgi:hypothetical protein